MSHDDTPQNVSEPATQPPRLRLAIVITLVAAVLATVAGLAVRAHDYHQLVTWTDAQELPTVQLVAPLTSADAHRMTLPGHIEAWISAPIHARVSGYLKSWSKDIGSTVNAGDTLGVIDTPELDQQYDQAKAVLVRARADEHLAQVTSQRWQHLLTSNSVSKQEADEKSGEAAVAAANVLSAQADMDRLAALESFKHITAPFSGTVTSRSTDIGDLISATSESSPALFTVADTSKMRLYVRIPQSYASSIKPGMTVDLSVLEHPGVSYKATLIGSSASVNQASGSLLAQFEAPNPNGALLPGDYAEVNLPVSVNTHLISVPATVLIFRAAGPQIAVLGADHRVQLRDVHIGMDLGDALEIDHGLQPGDRIIDHPPDSLAQGDQVRLATTTPAAHSSSARSKQG
ncbi:efflux RND transporter periplasmic adaptor subunit [Rhodanobacter sp. C05]|uniref:efflux RND transporter periplasmic adaptor subunit n=1 Tax=Rhodanobacter sp. C05 TaxID=1945855 RepID=UPI000985D927|nr:efflux RND transporter periplasmic adaptor subunit [Rhodanobacter sp. C05]OOG41882.1 efflux transporter periplasmic adaptor subunit [Rhodanobacter sp. C05]